jgi:SAM-dependent methyltransferase
MEGSISRSEETSRAFYARLGAEGLASRTRPEWDAQIVAALVELIPRGRVLDVGCGYGRVALPLARAGYEVDGLDVSTNLVDAARAAAEAAGLRVGFTVASMTSLPYPSKSFDAAICLWSGFNELLEEDEQVRAIAELWRVLRPGGIALVEGRLYTEPTEAEIASGVRHGPEHRVESGLVEGIPQDHFRHDERSFRRICAAAGVARFDVFERDWAVRRRLFLRLDKPP